MSLFSFLGLSSGDALRVGAKAPEPAARDHDGRPFSFAELYRRGWALVYFYPKADTPGCTTQACSIRDHSADYAARDAVVIGVSPDPVADVKKFHDKHAMDFTLLADAEHAVAEQFGVWAEKSMYGRKYWGNLRSTFVIDRDGTIARVFPKVSPKTHDEVVLEALDELARA